MSDVIVAPEVRDLNNLSSQLAAWLQRQMPQAKDIRLENLAYPFGAGQSHETILFDLHWTENNEARMQGAVVRIKPTRHTVYPDDLFTEQYQLMRLLHEDGRVRVAKPLWYEADPALLGAPFFVMEKVKGRVAVSIPPYPETGWVKEATPAQRRRMWENGVRQLAAIQLVPREKAKFLAGPPGEREGLEQEWGKYVRFAEWVAQYQRWPALEAKLAQLRSHWPKNQPPGLVWGDARIGNMMFDENFEVAAVVDWEQPSLGGALHDLAWWVVLGERMHGAASGRPWLDGVMTRQEIIDLWRDITGISTDDFEWYEDFTNFKVACLSIRTFALKEQPLPSDEVLAQRLGL